MPFVQLIEYRTKQNEQVESLMDEWMRSTEGKRSATRAVHAADHDAPGTYFELVEFPSYEDAMRNSALPETDHFARRMRALCDGEPIFHNLDVMRDQSL